MVELQKGEAMVDERHKVDALFVLVGKNTLPNYVAAQLLLRSPAKSRLILVYSEDTASQRQLLEDTLKAEGFQQFENVLVKESNPLDIENNIGAITQKLTGKVGLNYTGGTKAMSVHAYRALDENVRDVQFSYLNARGLSLMFAHESIPCLVGTEVSVSLKVLLGLHSRTLSFKADPIWPQTARTIADLHSSDDVRKMWNIWIAQTFFQEPPWPQFQVQSSENRDAEWQHWVRKQHVWQEFKRRKWKTKTQLKNIQLSVLNEFTEVQATLLKETGLSSSDSFSGDKDTLGLIQKGGFGKSEDLGKWFEGTWLESYVLDQVQQLRQQGQYGITDTGHSLQAHSDQQVEIDVAFTRGYQLFALACTTSDDKGLCKSKLLEVVVRAEQLGGAEARSALICCYPEPRKLENEIADLSGEHVRVFGRDDLMGIQTKLGDWIMDVSGR